MAKRSNGHAAAQPAWFLVSLVESGESRWVKARGEREAVRKWCEDYDRQEFWQYNDTAVIETVYGGLGTHPPDRPCAPAKKWHVDASQPPAWITERVPSEA